MARRYSISADAVTNESAVTPSLLGLTSAATIRPRVYDILVGSRGTVNDYACGYVIQRYTAAGTATAVTPQALDPGDPASLAAAGSLHTAEPTLTANAFLLRFSLNLRATFRWVAAPGGELVLPATAANGVALVSTGPTTAFNIDPCVHFEE